MAKGRKLKNSRSERYLDAYGYNNQTQGAANGAAEFEEDEVWSMMDDSINGADRLTNGEWTSLAISESNGSISSYRNRRPPPRIDRHHRQVGGLSLAFVDPNNSSSPRIVHQFHAKDSVAESPRGRHVAASAPVNVPDWSKIYRVNSIESFHDSDEGFDSYDSELVPPHVYLARESGKTSANSVFEGVGRTLKGRDLSRVRDAVWSQTGFDG